MKKLIILILFLPLILQGQEFKIKKNTVKVNQDIIAFYKANINLIEKVGNDSVIFVPAEKTFLPDVKVRNIDGYLCSYEKTITGLGKKITLFKNKCKTIKFEFHKHKKGKFSKPIKQENDENSFLRPKDLKEKLEKIEKIKPKSPKGKP